VERAALNVRVRFENFKLMEWDLGAYCARLHSTVRNYFMAEVARANLMAPVPMAEARARPFPEMIPASIAILRAAVPPEMPRVPAATPARRREARSCPCATG
jgi:hypothetical protein